LERVIALLHPIASDTSHSSQYVTAQAIRCADELILNKQDLYVPGHWEGFKSGIVKQNPYARIWETTHARIDAAALLAPVQQARPTKQTNVIFGEPRPSSSHKRADYHPIATTVKLPSPLNRTQFETWTKSLPKELERAKGFFRFAGEPELQEFQYAPPGAPTIAPIMLLDEPSPAIVLIGRGYDVEQLRAALLACMES
jgi:G3E family GTPase